MFMLEVKSQVLKKLLQVIPNTSRWEKLFIPYLVAGLSPRAKNWCMCAFCVNDDVHILLFQETDKRCDFRILVFYGDLILNSIYFHFQVECICCIPFPICSLIVTPKEIISVGYLAEMPGFAGFLCWMRMPVLRCCIV